MNLPSTLKYLFQLGEACTHETKLKIVACKTPADQWIKINSDGSAVDNPGLI